MGRMVLTYILKSGHLRAFRHRRLGCISFGTVRPNCSVLIGPKDVVLHLVELPPLVLVHLLFEQLLV